MRHAAASALLVALASASQPPGGWPGYNNYPPPPQEQPPQQWGGYQQYGEQPQYGSEAVEPATADDDAHPATVATQHAAERAHRYFLRGERLAKSSAISFMVTNFTPGWPAM